MFFEILLSTTLIEPIEVGYDVNTNGNVIGNITLTIRVSSHPSTGAPRPFSLAVSTRDGTASTFHYARTLHTHHLLSLFCSW